MTQKVLWSSCSRLSCASAESPDVVICLTSDLLAPITCNDDTTYTPTTLNGTLVKVWKDQSACNSTCNYRYLISYDESELEDPTVFLTTADISGVFCQGCLTTYIQDEIRRIMCMG